MKIAVSNPRYANAAKSWIDVDLAIDGGTPFPFTASAEDPMGFGAALFAELVAGKHGPIAEYVAPAPPKHITQSNGKAPGIVA